ncbi:hypothetical protein SAY86_005192 [Trapa natans]|uniref:GDSL esterase/lipase n=1 Tax=Trapa natans TaxID=22666 RepID=A0AAN7L314_TRANT|nr:hypothetical protein SAY86_005192 [Trapa natans]
MESPWRTPSILLMLSLFVLGSSGYEGGGADEAKTSLHHLPHRGPDRSHEKSSSSLVTSSPITKLFVFGDSYVDTGNADGNSWGEPYGITYPGKPAGRMSDGRVLTDFLASYLGLKSPPAPYRRWTTSTAETGVNFATGGTGVFNTLNPGPNMSTQIDQFQNLLGQAYSFADLNSSAALVTISGNDYTTYIKNKGIGAIVGLKDFITTVVIQLTADVKRIHDLGVSRVLVSNVAPLGCLPIMASFTGHCLGIINDMADFHNQQLQQAVQGLSSNLSALSPTTGFTLLDLHSSFLFALDSKGLFENLLKPCCATTSLDHNCGYVDSKTGEKKYSICMNPQTSLFWDWLHPTQAGWDAVFSNLANTINQQL